MSTNPTQRPPRRSAAPATLVDALIGAPITLRRIGDIPAPGGGPIGGAGEWIWPPWPSKRSILSHEDKPLVHLAPSRSPLGRGRAGSGSEWSCRQGLSRPQPSGPVQGLDHRPGPACHQGHSPRDAPSRRDGDRINAVLAAAGYNFSLLLRWFEELLRALSLILRRALLAPRLI
jgi:hypothetical protein